MKHFTPKARQAAQDAVQTRIQTHHEQVLALIRNYKACRLTLKQIADQLNKEHVPTPAMCFKDPTQSSWHPTSVNKILQAHRPPPPIQLSLL